jgi:glycosyl transferase, family 25
MTKTIETAQLRTYVVNLRRRADRRKRMRRILPPELNATYTSDWDGPFDGADLSVADLERAGYRLFPWRISSSNPWWNRPLKLGEIGCTLSHLACWRDAATRPETYTLVLEDDAVLKPHFVDILLRSLDRLASYDEHAGFDLLYLGRCPLEPDHAAITGFVKPGYSHCTFAYLLTRHAVTVLLAARLEQAIVPVDEFLPATYIAHPRADLRARFPPQLRALAFDPPLVRQLPKEVAGSDTEDSGFALKQPNAPASAR